MWNSWLDFFVDPILAAPMWATMLMCLITSVMGVLMVVQKRALLGEAISHTTYLGIAVMIYASADLMNPSSTWFPFLVMIGALASALMGVRLIFFMEKKQKVSADSALCFVLSTFLGLGVLMASRLQLTHPVWSQKIQMFLYGQAATITMSHVWIYAVLTVLIVTVLYCIYPRLLVVFFDRQFAKTADINTHLIHWVVEILLVCAIVVGIRSVGVLMMSGMLIAPAAAAKAVGRHFSHVIAIAGFFGVVSGVIGNVVSVVLSQNLQESLANFRVTFPTGPMILISSVFLSLILSVFGKRKGYFWRLLRRNKFRISCTSENILKALLKQEKAMTFWEIKNMLVISSRVLIRSLFPLILDRFLVVKQGKFSLNTRGELRAKRIVRLHRLWEVYLFNELGVHAGDVHRSAEEMEHILTPEIERQLIQLLGNPEKDPHDQIIPLREV